MSTFGTVPGRLAELEKRLSRIQKGQRISHGASVENAQLTVNDDTGSLRTVLGPLGDGTVGVMAVNGPPPPQPSPPIVSSVIGGVSVAWDGLFTNGAVLPLDWQRIEVHASILASYEPIPATLATTIETAQGATVIVPCDTPVYVRLLARSTSGTASIASAIVGPVGPAPVVADDILDGIVTTVKLADDAVTAAKVAVNAIDSAAIQDAAITAGKIGSAAVVAGKIASGAVLLNTLGGPLGDLASQRYADYFRDTAAWAQLSASSGGTWTINPAATDTPSGGGKLIATGDVQVASTALIPQDSDTLYRVMVRVRATAQPAGGPATVYLGAVGVAEDGVTLVNRAGANSNTTQHYCCTAGGSVATADGWKTYVGWIQGHSATGVTAPAGPATDPRSPELTHADVRYLRPMLWLNFGVDTTAVMEVEAVTVEAIRTGVVGSTNLITGSVTAGAIATDAVTAGKVAADAITAREILAGSVNTAELAAGAVTANEIAASTITAGQLAANSVTATQIAANAVQTAALAADSVAAGKIAADVVTAREIAALAVTANEIAANTITSGKLAAGSVDATAIAATAITGKTITGGTITGSLVQTAASGERITLNESSANKVLVYNSSGTAIGELSAAGLLLKGSTGAVLSLNPNATYPSLSFFNAGNTTAAVIEVTEPVTGDANLELLSGKFSGSGYTQMRWRHYLSRDAAVIERYAQDGAPFPKIGGRLFMNDTYGNIGYINENDTTQSTGLTIAANLATLANGRLAVTPPASSNSAVYVEPATGHTGNLLRLFFGADKFKVDKDGNVTAAGTLSASNFPDGAWQDWTPTWTTSSGSATPSFGNATVLAKYTKIGRTVLWRMEITFGSTTNFGSSPASTDNWRFSAPVTAAGTSLDCGFGEVQDASASGGGIASRLGTRVRLTTTTTFELETATGRVDGTALTTPNWGVMDSLNPWTWANGDSIRVSGFYESAS